MVADPNRTLYKNADPTGEAARARRLADQYGFPYVDLEHFQVDHALFRDIPLELMIRYQFLPERRENGHIAVVVGDPTDVTNEHIGGLVLQAGHTRLYLTNYTIDLNRGVLSGLVNFKQRADLFTIGAATPQGVTLALTPGAASVLNSTFGVTAFTPGLVIGYGNPVLR